MITPMNLFVDVFSGCLQWSNIKGMNLREFVFKEGPDLQRLYWATWSSLSFREVPVHWFSKAISNWRERDGRIFWRCTSDGDYSGGWNCFNKLATGTGPQQYHACTEGSSVWICTYQVCLYKLICNNVRLLDRLFCNLWVFSVTKSWDDTNWSIVGKMKVGEMSPNSLLA